jgi:hypothetical protein
MNKVRPEELDRVLDAYVDWREECLALTGAYERWSSGADPDPDRHLAFAAYMAALDREQQACSVYENRCNRVARQLSSGPGPIARLWRRKRQPRPAAA